MHQLETTLAQLQLRAAQLADKRVLAEAALTSATTARQTFRLEGDLADDKLDAKLQNDVDICRSKLTGLDADIAALQAKITETERGLDAERAAAERKAASEKLARDLDKVEEALPNCLDAGRRFVSSLEVLHHNFEATQMATFLANALSQVEIASGFVLQELRGSVRGIADGAMPIPAPKPEPVPPVVAEQPPPMQTVFLLRSVKFRDHAGKVVYGMQYEDSTMPVQTAQRALRCSAAVSLNDPRRRELHGAKGGRHVDPHAVDIVDVDDEQATRPPHIDAILASDPVLRAAGFREIDRSAESRVLKISVPRL